MNGWKYFWRRYFGWFPIQFCMVCGKWYWGGLPRFGWDIAFDETRRFRCLWAAWMQDYCCRACADEDMEMNLQAHCELYPNDDSDDDVYDPFEYPDVYGDDNDFNEGNGYD